MKFETRMRFDAPAQTVLQMFSDREYFEEKYRISGFRGIEVLEHEVSEQRFTIRIQYRAPADSPLPDFAKKFMPDEAVVIQSDVWDLELGTGRLQVDLKGVPAKVSADMKLQADGKGCVNVLNWTVSSGIPLVGGKLEKLIAQDIQSKAAADEAHTRTLLERYAGL